MLISVLLPARNAALYIAPALKSLLNQTYKNFEILVLEEGSTDNTLQIIKSFNDPRIKILSFDSPLGLARSLNQGIHQSRGELIARMDADDLAHPRRFESQVAFLSENPDVSLVGTWIKRFWGPLYRTTRMPLSHEQIRSTLLFECAFAHPTVMLKKSDFLKYGLLYDETCKRSEDYELWGRAVEKLKTVNLPQILLKYRVHSSQIGTQQNEAHKKYESQIRKTILQRTGLTPTNEELKAHDWLCSSAWLPLSDTELDTLQKWVLKLTLHIQSKSEFDLYFLEQKISLFWTKAAYYTQRSAKGFSSKLKKHNCYYRPESLDTIVRLNYLLKGALKPTSANIGFK